MKSIETDRLLIKVKSFRTLEIPKDGQAEGREAREAWTDFC